MEFGDRLRESRLKKGLTQEQLAKMIGVAKSTLTGYEKGNREPDVFKIKQLIKILEVDSSYLLGLDILPPASTLTEKISRLDPADQDKTEAYVDGLLSQDKYNEDAAADARMA